MAKTEDAERVYRKTLRMDNCRPCWQADPRKVTCGRCTVQTRIVESFIRSEECQ